MKRKKRERKIFRFGEKGAKETIEIGKENETVAVCNDGHSDRKGKGKKECAKRRDCRRQRDYKRTACGRKKMRRMKKCQT